jgi:hypothetical protein
VKDEVVKSEFQSELSGFVELIWKFQGFRECLEREML